MREFGTVIFGLFFVFMWVVGVLASLSVSLLILIGAFSLIQMMVGVPQDATLIYQIFNGGLF